MFNFLKSIGKDSYETVNGTKNVEDYSFEEVIDAAIHKAISENPTVVEQIASVAQDIDMSPEAMHAFLIQTYAEKMKAYSDDITKFTPTLQERSQYLKDAIEQLREIGATNSNNYKILEAELNTFNEAEQKHQIAKQLVSDLDFLQENIYSKAMFIPTEDFLNFLNKYNLICSDLKHYIGTIPEENLNDLISIRKNFSNIRQEDKTKLYSMFRARTCYSLEYNIARAFGFTSSTYESENNARERRKKEIEKKLKALKEQIQVFPFLSLRSDIDQREFIHPNIRQYNNGYISYELKTEYNSLFIAAPEQDIDKENLIKYEVRETSRPLDPVVFQPYKELGVITYTMWGKEAEDDIIKHWREKIHTDLNNIN